MDFAFWGIFSAAVCGTIDLIRCYMFKVGDLGKFSRVGVFFFGISMVIVCINEMVQKQVQFAENAKTELISAEIIQTLVTAIDAKDIYTKGHSTRVFDPHMTDVLLELLDEDALSIQQKDNEKKDNQIDVSSVVRELVAQNVEPGAIKINQEDMGKLYQYISGLHDRFGIETHMILISLIWEEDVAMADVDKAMKAMEYSIIQSLRAVDVMTRVSESQYLIVLTEAHTQNIQMIIDRVFTSFFKSSQNTKIKPIYAIK